MKTQRYSAPDATALCSLRCWPSAPAERDPDRHRSRSRASPPVASRSSIPSTRRSSRPRSSPRPSSGATRPKGVAEWMVLLRFDGTDELLRFPTTEPRWRPSEADWAVIKQRSVERDARGGDRRRRPGREACLVRERPHPHLHGPGRRLDLLSRGSAAVHHGRPGSLAHPLALRVDRLRDRAAHRPRGPAGLRELPLLLERRQRAGPRRGLRQRQGSLRDPPRVRADGAERREDHHLERLQEETTARPPSGSSPRSRPTAAT